MNELTPAPSRLLRVCAVAAQWVLWLLVLAWLALGLAWGVLHGWIVPRIDEFRPALEARASQELGVPVRIGKISARTSGLIPSFELQDVTLQGSDGQTALRLSRVLVALSPASLLRFGFEQIYIDQPDLDVRRTSDGRILVAGLDLSRRTGGGTGALDWFFEQSEFVIHDGTLRWTDDERGAPPLALQAVDVVVRNGARSHQIRIDATPPPDWGQRFTLMARLQQPLLSTHAGQWQQWQGQAYADFAQGVDLTALGRYVDLPQANLTQAAGALRAWADVSQGVVNSVTVDLALPEFAATLAPGLDPLVLRSVQGRLALRRLAGGFEFTTRALQFATPDGLQWPASNLRVAYRAGAGAKKPAQGEIAADRLDLAVLGRIASRIPLGQAAHKALAAYAPSGRVQQLQASWRGALDAPAAYSAKGRVTGLEIAAAPAAQGGRASSPPHPTLGRPGVRGASVDFDLTQAGGQAKLAIADGSLTLPGLFEDATLPLNSLSANLRWQLAGSRVAAQLSGVQFANADAQGEFGADWHTSDSAKSASRARFPGVLNLQGQLTRAQATRVYRYLPLVLPADVRNYVRDAITRGSASAVQFAVKGDLHDFPFSDAKQGVFHISADLRDVSFAFVPRRLQAAGEKPWPALTQLSAQLIFDRRAMQVKNAVGRFGNGLPLTRADVQIRELANATVEADAQTRAPLKDMLAFVANSPLDALTGQALTHASATGPAELKLKMALPLDKPDKVKLQGSVTLAGNDLDLMPQVPMLSKAQGVVHFTETGFRIADAKARALGGDVAISGGLYFGSGAAPAGVPTTIRAQGRVSADALQQATAPGVAASLARHASGSTAYSVVVAMQNGAPEVTATSNLQGLALSFPAPLAKSADSAMALRINARRVAGAGSGAAAQAAQDDVQFDLGRIVAASLRWDTSGAEPRLLRGAIAVGRDATAPPPLPDSGLVANVNLDQLDIDAWQAVLAQAQRQSAPPSVPQSAPQGEAAAAPSAAQPTAAPAAPVDLLPNVIALRVGELTVQGRVLHHVVLGASRDGRTWRANIDADELDGYAEYRQNAGTGPGRIYARLARLRLGESSSSDVERILEKPSETMPALDIVVEDFQLRSRHLGRVEVDAVNRRTDGGGREWRLNKLTIALPDASFDASGRWAAVAADASQRRLTMDFKLEVGDAGALLARFGMKDVVRGGSGSLAGQIGWSGSPLALDYPTMDGQFHVEIDNGQFLKADPGLARLLGVLSLQSLPRRLTLDFHDLFSEGFAFDFVRGDVKIARGIASTNNLQMKGVSAAVLMDGQADLSRETQDLRVVVVPELNAGTVSLIATAINPAIGLTSFLAQLFLRRPLIEASTQEFNVTGTWTDPKVTKVERKSSRAEATEGQGGTR